MYIHYAKTDSVTPTLIPHPSSCTCNDFIPPSLTVIVTAVAPASRLFSNSSFTALAGRYKLLRDVKQD